MQWFPRRAAGAALSCALLLSALPMAASAAAPNDLRRHWSASAVYTLMERQIVAGYSDHTFRPDQSVTREEAVGLLKKVMDEKVPGWDGASGEEPPAAQDLPQEKGDKGRQDETGEVGKDEEAGRDGEDGGEPWTGPVYAYTDVDDSWARASIVALGADGVGLSDGTGSFYPRQTLTRGEAAILLHQATERWPAAFDLPQLDPAPAPLLDMIGCPSEEAVRTLQLKGVLSGRSDGEYHPNDPLTRAEYCVLLMRLAGYEPLTQVEYDPLPVCTVVDVPYISQVYPAAAWVGCEPTALLMGLKGKGYAQDVTLRQFLADMPKTSSNPAKGFVGSPYQPSETLRTTIYPAPLAAYGSNYGPVVDFSGRSVEELREELLLGNPVVIYVTLYWKTPYYRTFNIEGTQQSLLRNNHAVLVCGYDSTTNYYYIADPYNIEDRYHDYYYWISGDVLEPLYMVRQHAVAVE